MVCGVMPWTSLNRIWNCRRYLCDFHGALNRLRHDIRVKDDSSIYVSGGRPIVWMRLRSSRRKPSLSASNMKIVATSGISKPSRSRFIPTKMSKSPTRSCLTSSIRSRLSISLCKYRTRKPSFTKIVRQVLCHPLGQRCYQDAVASLL